jgi:hypothetical protein
MKNNEFCLERRRERESIVLKKLRAVKIGDGAVAGKMRLGC